MTAVELARAVSRRNPFAIDRDGNMGCVYCGNYRDYTSRDGKYGPGQHNDDCLWVVAHVVGEGDR